MPEASIFNEPESQASERGTTTSSTSSLRYMPGLDVMRGLAIVMVVIYHGAAEHDYLFVRYHSWSAIWLRAVLIRGGWGVHLFFILSGFLITGILLDSREQVDYFRNFYLRRVLRIVPAYLAILLALFTTHAITSRYLLVALFYLCNMATFFGAKAEYGPLWSLSVEEQFYIIWPLIVRKLSTRGLAWLSIGLIVFTPFLRFVLPLGPQSIHDTYYKLWDILDFFAAGSCLALAVRSPQVRPKLSKAVAPLLIAGSLLLVFTLIFRYSTNPMTESFLTAVAPEPYLFGFSGLILLAYLRPGIAALPIARPLVFLADISYGLYLCHVFLIRLIYSHWPPSIGRSWSPIPLSLLQFAVGVATSVVVAYISRNTLEKFFLSLKPKHPAGRQPA